MTEQRDRPTPRAAEYHLMDCDQKRRFALEQARENPVSCPACEVKLMAVDLPTHLAGRCAGKGEPHRASRWLDRRSVEALGIGRRSLQRWVAAGAVRIRGRGRGAKWLEKDVLVARTWHQLLGRGRR